MKQNEKDIDAMLKRYMPPLSREEREAAEVVRKRVWAELRAELDELKQEIAARRAAQGSP